MITFIDVERGALERTASNVDLQKFNSAAPTLNNTPNVSRSPSPVRKKSVNRTPTPSPTPRDIEAMNRKRRLGRLSSYSHDELDLPYLGAVIVTCFFTSGMIDAVSFNSWNCFTGMQTGNTVFAALGLGGLPLAAHPRQFVKSFVAIASFCMGTLFFNLIHRLPTGLHNQPSSRSRMIFILSFLLQTMLISVAAALVTVGVVSNRPFVMGQFSSGSQLTESIDKSHLNYKDLIPIVLLAFQASGQVCLSRVLGLIELPTIVLSTLYHDWTADLWCTKELWRQSSSIKDFVLVAGRRQNKRLMSIIALFLGGMVGGEMYKSKAQMAGALWLAATLKLCIVAAFAVWRKQNDDDEGAEK